MLGLTIAHHPLGAAVIEAVSAAADESESPPENTALAIVTIIISVIAIIATIVYLLRRRGKGEATASEPLLKAMGTVEWYATDVGDQLVAVPPDKRQKVVADASSRIESAHAELLNMATTSDNQKWNTLMVEMAATENAYAEFAESQHPETGQVAQHQHVLVEALDAFRSTVS